MRRFALLAAYTAIMLLRAAPAHAADVAAAARIDGKTLLPSGLKIHTCR